MEERSSFSRRRFLASVAVSSAIPVSVGVAGCLGQDGDNGGDGTNSRIEVETVGSNLEIVWGMEFGPQSKNLYFTERPGRFRKLKLGSGRVETLAEIGDTKAVGEGGLMGLAFHPDYPDVRSAYVYQTYEENGTKNRVLRYRIKRNEQLQRKETVIDGIPGATIHDGGRIAFGPSGKLFVTCGDASSANDAQDRGKLNGKILRLNPDGSVPRDNPFGNPVFSYGHRNPQGLAFHPETRKLYITEHGPATDDEINLIEKGGNYGWPQAKGKTKNPDYIDPLKSYTPTIAPGSAAFFEGSFYFGTLAGEHLRRVTFGSDRRAIESDVKLLDGEYGRLRTVIEGSDALYISTSNRDGRGIPTSKDDRILALRYRSS